MSHVLEILEKVGAILTNDHFVYTSGKHGSIYVSKNALYPHTAEASLVGEMFAQKFKNGDVDAVVAPALGGIVLSQWTGWHLSRLKNREVLGLYTEKAPEGRQIFTRGYDKLVFDKNVLAVEDVVNTGNSLAKSIACVQAAGGIVMAACAMVNRDPDNVTSEKFGVPFSSLEVLEAKAFAPENCPLCKNGVPINTSVGHGKKYLQNVY